MFDREKTRAIVVDPMTGSIPSWHVYLFALADGAAFKVGFSCNPLQRIWTFSSRYFERFDTARSQLLRFPDQDGARALEQELKTLGTARRVQSPFWVPAEAGGHTEWFAIDHWDVARERLLAEANELDGSCTELREFLHGELQRISPQFEPWAWAMAQRVCADWEAAYRGWPAPLSATQSLRDWLDAYRYFAIDLFREDTEVREFVIATARRRV